MKMKKIDTPNPRFIFVFSIASTLILFLLLVGCSFPSASESLDSELIQTTTTPAVQIDFRLNLPEPLKPNEKVVLEILDEVTGIPYNIRQIDMNQVDGVAVTTSLSVPSHSVLKYRYTKIGEETTSETSLSGAPIRYRMVYTDANHPIIDILQSWQDSSSDLIQSGTLEGKILDRNSNLPIPDILVSAGGQLTFSDSNGLFVLEGLSSGVHNIVFYAMDGRYRTYQQGAVISEGLVTPAEVKMTAMPPVTVTLNVTAPDDALGAPVRIAGNLSQLGNAFASLDGDMSLNPKRMPILSAQPDGILKIDLQLYAESDLRFKFTLGDGYWNAERNSSGGFRVRHLIVPDENITLDLTIESWRSPGIEPVTFDVTIPPGTAPDDEKYIQFKADEWTEPLPLWPLGNGEYLYILYSPLSDGDPVEYRFCRNGDCQRTRSTIASDSPLQILPSSQTQSISTTITGWNNWQVRLQDDSIVETFIPDKASDYSTVIELSPTMDPTWHVYAPVGISNIAEMGARSVIFSPQWFTTSRSPKLKPIIGKTPFHYELIDMLNVSQSMGLKVGLFAQPGSQDGQAPLWPASAQTEDQWRAWFNSYQTFILNYAKIAEKSGAAELIIGGKSLLPAFIGGINPDGSEADVPDFSEDFWLTLIEDIRETYKGRLVWGTNAHESMDPLPDFINEFDGIYISVSSSLAIVEQPSLEEIKAGFTNVIDRLVYEVYRSTMKPVTVALAYPSVDGAVQGCLIVEDGCNRDGLYQPEEIAETSINLDEQSMIYNAVLPVIASREWITGISVRGYDPTLISFDKSSSIAGKPASDVIQYWFTGLTSE